MRQRPKNITKTKGKNKESIKEGREEQRMIKENYIQRRKKITKRRKKWKENNRP